MSRNYRVLFLFLAAVGMSSACSRSVPPPRQVAFYHWASSWGLGEVPSAYLDSLGISRLYVRFFDVDREGDFTNPHPLAPLSGFPSVKELQQEIIPVIFITNRTLSGLSAPQVDTLASSMAKYLQAFVSEVAEIQLDCDWTTLTRDAFFHLVTAFRSAISDRTLAQSTPPLLSVTIRLHQYKYPEKTGVPPADRGMLMCYNTGAVDDWDTNNSILETGVAAQYLNPKRSYPLPLDVALPLFRWGVVFRDGYFERLIHNLGAADLQDSVRFSTTGQHRYRVLQNTFLDGYYLNEGDRIRLESVPLAELSELLFMLRKNLPSESRTVAFYHLDQQISKRYPAAALQALLPEYRTAFPE